MSVQHEGPLLLVKYKWKIASFMLLFRYDENRDRWGYLWWYLVHHLDSSKWAKNKGLLEIYLCIDHNASIMMAI